MAQRLSKVIRHSRTTRLAAYFCGAHLFACLFALPSAQAWGCKGHQTVALIAENHLTPEARQLVQQLLTANPIDPKLKRYCGNALADPMADASTWPDDIRGERKNGEWHYIDIPRGAHRGPLEPYCGKGGCVISAISEQVAILNDKTADASKRADAIRYIIHFVGDLHQPLHATTNDDEGGNCVPVNYLRRRAHQHGHSFTPNLHNIWDGAIIERDMEFADPAEYADTLQAAFASDIGDWLKAGIHLDQWAWESHDQAEATAYGNLHPRIPTEPNVPVRSCSDDNNIGDRMFKLHVVADETYQRAAEPIVEKRVAQAGVRLALILNDAAKSAQ